MNSRNLKQYSVTMVLWVMSPCDGMFCVKPLHKEEPLSSKPCYAKSPETAASISVSVNHFDSDKRFCSREQSSVGEETFHLVNQQFEILVVQ